MVLGIPVLERMCYGFFGRFAARMGCPSGMGGGVALRLVVGLGGAVLFAVFVVENRAGKFGIPSSWLTLAITGLGTVALVLVYTRVSARVASVMTPGLVIAAGAYAAISIRRKKAGAGAGV
jgi:hypothetical protein